MLVKAGCALYLETQKKRQPKAYHQAANRGQVVNAGIDKAKGMAEGRSDEKMGQDTAAPHAVATESVRRVLEHGTIRELLYNKENLLNPFFIVE